MRNPILAKAVAAAIASAAAPAAFAVCTSGDSTQQAACAAPAFYTGGSSAAVSGIGSGFGSDTCAVAVVTFQTVPTKQPAAFTGTGSTLTKASTPDFRAFYCGQTKGAMAAVTPSYTLYYRADGGSVVGAYAPLNNAAINELDLNTAWCTADPSANTEDCATAINSTNPVPAGLQQITGSDINNAPTDSFTGPLQKVTIPYGISDEEPGIYGNTKGSHFAGGGNDDPLASGLPAPYPYTFLGADATPDALQGMNHQLLFQQVFGFVASSNLGISNISTADITAILSGSTTDWAKIVNPTTGTRVTPTTTKIIVCQRDLGSGTRTGADVIFTGTGCNPYGVSGLHNVDNLAVPDNFSTADALACVNNNNNAISYVSIDNFTKVAPVGTTYANVVQLALDGRSATNKLAAEGAYQYAVEASINTNGAYPFSTNTSQAPFFAILTSDLQALATAPATGHVNVIPGLGGNAFNNGTLQEAANLKTYVTSYYRDVNTKGNTCDFLHL